MLNKFDHIDLAEAERFLKLLDPAATSFEFRTFDDNVDRDSSTLLRVFYGPLSRYAAELKCLNGCGAGVFVVINETDGKGRAAENIRRVRAVFADLDGAPLEPVMAGKLPPHIVVKSSEGRWHTYWLVEGMPRQDFTAVQKAIIARFNSDPGIHDLPRVMRLPGFFHRKSVPFLVHIVSTSGTPPYSAINFERAEVEVHTPGQQHEVTLLDMWKAACALEVIPNDNLDWFDWNRIGMAAWVATGGSQYGFEAFDSWSSKSSKYNARRTRKVWKGYHRSPPDQLGIGTLIFLANEADPEWRDRMLTDVAAVMSGEHHG